MAVPALAVSAWYSHTPGTYWYALLYLGVGVLLPVLYVVWAIRTGRITDFHMAIRRERVAPFLVSILCGAAAWLMLVGLGAPRDFAAPVLALLLQTLLLFLITLFWQVSVHTAVTASLVTFCCMVGGQGALLLIGLIPLVAWARLYLGRHTLAQTVVGACVGVSCFALLFALHGIAW
jgi:membrane-associated phospholipid phosphatase